MYIMDNGVQTDYKVLNSVLCCEQYNINWIEYNFWVYKIITSLYIIYVNFKVLSMFYKYALCLKVYI